MGAPSPEPRPAEGTARLASTAGARSIYFRGPRSGARGVSRESSARRRSGAAEKPRTGPAAAAYRARRDGAIARVHARQIFDSRGNPTVEVDVTLAGGAFGRAAVPSGASTGTHEAVELRDGASVYGGKGVSRAVANVNGEIARAVTGREAADQQGLDRTLIELDGTANKGRLGANAILGVSLATARAQSVHDNIPLWRSLGGEEATLLPMPALNVLNGGAHADNPVDFQEFMLVPVGADSFTTAMRLATETYHELKRTLKARGLATGVGDEGGFAPALSSSSEALDAIMTAIGKAGYDREMLLGVDCAASEFYDKTTQTYLMDGRRLSPAELSEYYEDLVDRYPVILIEDPFNEDAFEDFAYITSQLAGTTIVGDDLFVTNVDRLSKGIKLEAANALLLKLNQIGTMSEAFDAATLAFRNGYSVVVSHRSGETEDTTIADVAVALGSDFIKTGAPARSERNAKYNQLLRIQEFLGDAASYRGRNLQT